jgi:hypothetical protein
MQASIPAYNISCQIPLASEFAEGADNKGWPSILHQGGITEVV